MCKEAKILRAFALSRHRAYVLKDRLTQRRAQAVTKILRVCDHFKDAKATGWISQIRVQLLEILPSEDSKFKSMREDILNILYSKEPNTSQ